MNQTLEKVASFIDRHRILAGSRAAVVAVSGGPDSVALLDILLRLTSRSGSNRGEGSPQIEAEPDKRISGPVPQVGRSPAPDFTLHVAHLDHGLRGPESVEDAEFVRSVAQRRELAITIKCADVKAAARALGRGIEEVARELRYTFLLGVAGEVGADRIVTGHTMNDQAETFLMRLIRGAGPAGLASMRPVASAHEFNWEESADAEASTPNNTRSPLPLLVRPLLCLTRSEVERYCGEAELPFRVDSSNLDSRYTRNRVRRDVLPALAAVNPRIVESIARAAENIGAEQEALEYVARAFLDEARLSGTGAGPTGRSFGQGHARYRLASFLDKPAGLSSRMLMQAFRQTSPGMPQITTAHLAAVRSLLDEGASGKRITLPGGMEVWREFNALVFTAPAEATVSPIELGDWPVEAAAGGFRLSLIRRQPGGLLKTALSEAREEKKKAGRDWMVAVLDDLALPERLFVRPRRQGERVRVFGQGSAKKLKKLMISHRIPVSRRETWPMVTTPDGQYVWSPGLPPADCFAARDETHGLAILRATEI